MARTTGTRRRERWPAGYDPQQTRQSLMDSALNLFERQGFDRTSVQEVADRAGLTKGAFYHHFESKDDLLRQIQEEYLDEQLAGLRSIVAAHADPRDAVVEMIRFSLASVAQNRPRVTIFNQERIYLTGERFRSVLRKRDEVEALLVRAISNGVASGAFRSDLNPRVAGFGLVGMCAWAYQWLNVSGKLSVDDVARQFGAMVLQGIEERGARKPAPVKKAAAKAEKVPKVVNRSVAAAAKESKPGKRNTAKAVTRDKRKASPAAAKAR